MRSGAAPGQEKVRITHQNDDLDTGTSLTLSDVLQMLRRHILFICIMIAVCVGAAFVYLKRVTPIYEATASIRIDPSRAGSLGLNDLISGGSMSQDVVSTEIAIIKSDAVTIDTLYSLSDSEFQQYTKRPKSALVILPGSTILSPAQEALLARFKGSIAAKSLEGTQLVSVSVRDPDPRMAALLTNHVIAAYLRQTFDSRYRSVSQVTQWLSSEMDTLRDNAQRSQRDLAAFQEKNNILMTDSGPTTATSSGASNTVMDRLRLLNTSIATAQADRIVKEAQLRAASTGNPAVLNSMFPSADLTSLQGEQGRLLAQEAALSSKFGAQYPLLAEVRADRAKIDAEINGHTTTVMNRLKQEYDAALANENMLQAQYADQTEKAYALNRQQAEFAVLRAEVNSSRELYNTLQYKLQQAGVDAGLAAVNTMLLDTARAPLLPVEPKRQTVLGFGLFLGVFVGVGLSFLLEATSDKVQNVEQLERTLHLPLLAIVPHFKQGEAKGSKGILNSNQIAVPLTLAAIQTPSSREAESFRSLRSSVLLSSLDKPPKTILITSCLPGEGKSTVASNFAVVMAQSGNRVLLVDADLRRPTIHTKFGMPIPEEGLSTLMIGDIDVEPFIQPLPDLPNLTMLPAGNRVALPAEMLSSNKLKSFVARWEQEFDIVIIDSAPLLIVSDSLPLSTWVDTLVLVIRYNITPMKALKRVRDVLERSDSNVAGLVLNDLSTNSLDYGAYKYGYGYYNN